MLSWHKHDTQRTQHRKNMITITKPFVFLRLKMKLASLMKHKSKKNKADDGEDDMREYVDLSWRFSHQDCHQAREVSPGERLAQLLTTLPHYDLLTTWLDTCDPAPCDVSLCCSCHVSDTEEDSHHYACVESNLSLIQSHWHCFGKHESLCNLVYRSNKQRLKIISDLFNEHYFHVLVPYVYYKKFLLTSVTDY